MPPCMTRLPTTRARAGSESGAARAPRDHEEAKTHREAPTKNSDLEDRELVGSDQLEELA